MIRMDGQDVLNVSVIIVNFNGLRFLENCLDTLKQAFRRHSVEIIVVDNASMDGSREWLRSCSGIVLIESSENLGFTGGNNLGVSHARGQNLLFINNDTRVDQPLDAMIDALSEPHVGIVGCRLVYGDGRPQPSIGFEHTPGRIVMSWLGLERAHYLPSIFRRLETNLSIYRQPRDDLAWVSGACFAMRAATWQKIEGFDTRFFMYCEDVDLGRRVREAGFRVIYRPDCIVTHFEGAGRPWIGRPALQRTTHSYLLYVRKYWGEPTARTVACALAAVFLARGIAFRALSVIAGERSKVRKDKAAGYAAVARELWRAVPAKRP